MLEAKPVKKTGDNSGARPSVKLASGFAALGVLAGLLWLPQLEAFSGPGTQSHGRRQASEATTMLVAGGALVGFGLVGRKRRAEKAAASR